MKFSSAVTLGLFLFFGLFQGCLAKSYPADKVREAVMEICREEYGIEEVDVKIKGGTIGVYLPLSKLFAADFKETAVTGKVRNLETLFEPSPEALEKIEDVLFAISRVLLSTDQKFQFYVLEATDVEKTGMQFILTGNVDDIKRVRVWDISRNEYRKRVIHELQLNHAVVWHKPVRDFFKDLSAMPAEAVRRKYFGETLTAETLQNLFLGGLSNEISADPKTEWKILDIRSAPVQKNQVLVYTKISAPVGLNREASELQYIFMLSLTEDKGRIVRIIPFQYRDETGALQHIDFPKELQVQDNLDRWETEFDLEEIHMGSFLAAQLTRRAQTLLASDERIQNTFRDFKLNFEYQEKTDQPPFFTLDIEAFLKDLNNYSRQSPVFHEDMQHFLTLTSQEFLDVVRSYQFESYDYLRLTVAQDPNTWILGRQDLELLRRKKIDMQGLLTLPRV